MNKSIITFFLISCLFACSKNIENEDLIEGFPVLSYDAEISETLILDQSNIIIDAPKANIIKQIFIFSYTIVIIA